MRTFLLLMAMLFSINTYATGSLSTNDLGEFNELTTEQQAAIVAEIAKKKAANAKAVVPDVAALKDPEQLTKWVSVGTAIGTGLAETAKQLGVAADEFAKSTIGTIAVILIVWTIIGADLVQLMVGSAWLCFWIPFCVWMVKRTMFELVNVPMQKGDLMKDRYVWQLRGSPEEMGGQFFMAFAYTAVGVAVGWFTILL
jgi:hypothetical protein